MTITFFRKTFFALCAIGFGLVLMAGCSGTQQTTASSTQDTATPAPENAGQTIDPSSPASPPPPSQTNTEWLAPPSSTEAETTTDTKNASISVAPTVEYFALAEGAEYVSGTTVPISVKGTGNFTEMRISEDPDFKDALWQAYSPNPSFEFSSKKPGKKEIYIQLKDANGKTTSVVSSEIRHEIGKIETVAGFPEAGPGDVDDTDDNPKTHLGRIRATRGGTVFDGVDTIYWTDTSAIKKYTISSGNLTTFVGDPLTSGYRNGKGKDARFGSMLGAITKLGNNLFVADYTNFAIRKVDIAIGEVTTLSGFTPEDTPRKAGFANGPALQARFNYIVGSCLTNDGTYIYVCDSYNHAIRQINPKDGSVITIAGAPPPKAEGVYLLYEKPRQRLVVDKTEENGKDARFYYPYGIFFHAKSNSLIVSDSCNSMIRKINLSAKGADGNFAYPVIHFSGGTDGTKDGDAKTAQFISCQNRGGGIDPERDILITGGGNVSGTLRTVELSGPNAGTVKTIAGIPPATLTPPASTEGMGLVDTSANTQAKIADADGAYSFDGTYMYFSHSGALRRIHLDTHAVETIQGMSPGSDVTYLDDIGTKARLSYAYGMVPDGKGNAYFFAEPRVLRKINLDTREVTTVAGVKGQTGYADGDGEIARWSYFSNFNSDFDTTNGILYFADYSNCAIRKWDTIKGVMETIAGAPPPKATCGFSDSTDGTGFSARFKYPNSIAFDKGPVDAEGKPTGPGILYVTDQGNKRIRKIELGKNNVTTLAGSDTAGYTDGKGDKAQLSAPYSLQILPDGKLYTNTGAVIRSVDKEGNVETLAGVPLQPGDTKLFVDGVGDQARFRTPRIVGADASGTALYILDNINSALRKLDLKTKEVTTVFGGPDPIYPKDGFLSETRTMLPNAAVMIDPTHMLISEGTRIRMLTLFKQ